MMKKEKNPKITLRDLFVKLSRIYKKDMYLFNRSICFMGDKGDEDAIGMILCILEPKYQYVVETILLADIPPSLLYEINITGMKDAIDNDTKFPIKVITDDGKIKEVQEKIENMTQYFDRDNLTWINLGSNEELIKTIFDKKLIFKMPIARGDKTGSTAQEYITISSQMIPLCTAKTISAAFLHYEAVNDYEDLYTVQIKFKFTHFHMEAMYYVVMLPFL